MSKIDSFRGDYHWLSNFYNHPITYKGLTYPSTEAAYQAHKSPHEEVHLEFTKLSPRSAKEFGQKIEKRDDWQNVKVTIMYEVLVEKFKDRVLRKKLIDTGDAELIEGNWWHDCFYGDCSCMNCINIEGKNVLGKLLMQIRSEIK